MQFTKFKKLMKKFGTIRADDDLHMIALKTDK